MVVITQATGKLPSFMATASINGLMAECITDNMKMTRNQAMEFILGLMERNMKDIGSMANNTVKDHSLTQKERQS